MPAERLTATVRNREGMAIIDLSGELDAFGERPLQEAFAAASAEGPRAVILNFTRVEYINSKGIALIVSLIATARETGRRLLAYGLSEHYVEIFQITRLTDFITLVPDEVAAFSGLHTAA